MSSPIERLVNEPALRTRVRRALESGIGMYRRTWPIERVGSAVAVGELAEDLLAWCRDVLSRTRGPYGVDAVTLALAVLDEDGEELASTSFGLLRPEALYQAGCAEERIEATVRRWARDGVFDERTARMSALLFSWGDLTRELLLAG